MARHEGRSFQGERVLIEGNEYIDCRFENCVMVFSGGDEKSLISRCGFGSGVMWTFEGPAQRTIQFLAAMYHGIGAGGREQVEEIFAAIRRSRPQG
jgi:hypothetical protein